MLLIFLCLTKPAFMRRPWRITPCPAVHGRAFLFFLGIILQSLSSFAIRLRGSACALPDARRLRHLRCDSTLQFMICGFLVIGWLQAWQHAVKLAFESYFLVEYYDISWWQLTYVSVFRYIRYNKYSRSKYQRYLNLVGLCYNTITP